MKDYSLNSKHAKTFVLNYTVNDGKITINFAEGDGYTIPYTEENKKKLDEKMREQVIQSDSFRQEKKKELDDSSVSILGWSLCFLVSISLMLFCLIYLGILGVFSLILIKRAVKRRKAIKEIIKDLDKNKMFLAREKLLNETVKENSNILAKVEEVQDIVYPISKEKPVFTLNNIDEIEYEQLERIIDIVDIENKFEFDYVDYSEDQGVVVKKRLKKDQ